MYLRVPFEGSPHGGLFSTVGLYYTILCCCIFRLSTSSSFSTVNSNFHRNNHHFQRQQLNTGDPLSISSSSQFNLNRPFVRSPSNPPSSFRTPAFSSKPLCGYESCHPTNPNSLNVHIVCHTHLDTGWVETYDEYYHRYVKIIYESVVSTLSESPDRKFIVVETSFFSRWFNEQSDAVKGRVSWLIKSGQLEFISGGWSMNDEAAAHYQDVIDQLTYGLRWLNSTFGPCGTPKVGWQIDPFGHSREQASIFSQMAFDGLFLGRIDYQDKLQREKTQTLEMIWKSSPSIGSRADIFTSVLPNVYWPPTGFCFDINCWDEPLHENNIRKKALEFIDHVKKQAKSYGTNHTIITMGMDFYFRDAKKWYHNLDKLIQEINSLEPVERVRVFYSTPSCYLKALHNTGRRWSVKLDDFFPYADAINTYWTGYFTSRPSLKYHIRIGNNILQAAKQLAALVPPATGVNNGFHLSKIRQLQETMGILQHHDAVTGTCKQYVANDYTKMLMNGIKVAQESLSEAYDRLWIKEGFVPAASTMTFCNLLNASRCDVTQTIGPNSDVVVVIYNPVAHPVKHYVRLPIRGISSGFRVRDSTGVVSSSQIVPNHEAVSNLPERLSAGLRTTSQDAELVFRVMLPPLGFTSVAVDRVDPAPHPNHNHVSHVRDGNTFSEDIAISNGRLSAVFDHRTGLLKSVTLKDGRQIPLTQNFWVYDAEGRKMGEKPSGAYAFNPTPTGPREAASRVSIRVMRGPLVEEVHQTFNPWLSQVVRVYQHVDYVEFDWVVGPIPIDNWFFDPGQEVISRFVTDLTANGTFFTDSNARETIRRVRDHRPTWELDTTEKVASNYYPVNGWIFIRDYERDLQLTILPDRPQGGSSLKEGQIELMVHRRLTMDDGFGMDEALNEPGEDGRGLIVRGKHRVVFGDIQESVRQMRMMSKSMNLRPILSFRKRELAHPSERQKQQRSFVNSKFIGLNRKLPPNINLLTLEPWEDGRILLRLEHIFEVNEDSKYSRPRRISLRDLFTTFVITSVQEMTLSATQPKETAESLRMKFTPEIDPYANYTNVLTQIDSEDLETGSSLSDDSNNSFTIVMYPMEIRTFLVTYVERENCVYTGSSIRGNNRGRLRTPNC